MYTGLTTEICQRAWDMLVPAIRHGANSGLLNGYKGSLVVLNPANPDGEPFFTASLNDDPEQFPQWAEAKTRVVARTGVDTSRMRDAEPHLYQAGDIVWPGGIARSGMIVAFSGVQGEYDEMIGEWFVAAVRAICRVEFLGPEGGDSQPTQFLGRS
jgi:hypothetical protein